MPQHKYADLLMAIAERAKVSETPWDVLQILYPHEDVWYDCNEMPDFDHPTQGIRFKPRTITATITFPEPVRKELEVGREYFVAYIQPIHVPHPYTINKREWRDSEFDHWYLNNGLIYLTEEEAQQAWEAKTAPGRVR